MNIRAMTCERLENPLCIDALQPRLGWCYEGTERDCIQTAYRLLVATDPALLEEGKVDLWDSGRVESAAMRDVCYAGTPLKSKQMVYWCVRAWMSNGDVVDSAVARFGMGLLKAIEWGCGFIGHDPADPEGQLRLHERAGGPSPYLRRRFVLDRPVKSARLFVTAFGVYEAYLNGIRIGDAEMAPGWTDYNESIQYQGYDVTDALHEGENMVGAVLGDGWFASNLSNVGREQYGGYPLGLRLHLAVTYADGTTQIVTTDEKWRSRFGAIRYADNQTGEYYDATKALEGWSLPGSGDEGWMPCVPVNHCSGTRFKAERTPPVRVERTLTAQKVWRGKNGWLVDFGQNMVGRVSMKLREPRGTVITIRHGEMLHDEATLYTENLRTAVQTDVYIAAGTGEECYRPHFTFHGFRYIEIRGLTQEPQVEDMVGEVMFSSCGLAGHVETSNRMVNRLFLNQLWGQRGNFLSIPTDCPQRDERMGWTGDAQIFSRTACYNMNCAAFYEKYIEDCLEAQKPNGAIPDVVPIVKTKEGVDQVSHGSAAWAEAIFIIPWNVYQMYGDTHMLKLAYPGMRRYVAYMQSMVLDDLCTYATYGDWLNVDELTDPRVLATAYYYYGVRITAKTAALLNQQEEAEIYSRLAENIRQAFCRELVAADGTIAGDTQCAYILALVFDMLPEAQRPTAVAHLVRTIARRDNHLATGFVGVSYLLPVLTHFGHEELAYELLLCDTYPSWGYSVKNGATTIWERWDSYTMERGFGDIGMNSFNHYSLGSVGEWMYRHMAGIRPLEPGFSRILVEPVPDTRLSYVNASYDSVSGKIVSRWEKIDGGFRYHIEIPVNTEAEIRLPEGSYRVTEGACSETASATYCVGSGSYTFETVA